MFQSNVRLAGSLEFPAFTGTRVMMMPIVLHDPASLPDQIASWRPAIRELFLMCRAYEGVGYVTIDEANVRAGETHRRPGLHVDGIGEDGRSAAYGGGGGGYGSSGMLLAASHEGCVAYQQEFDGWPAANGDCEHLRPQLFRMAAIVMRRGYVYDCEALTVHESIPADSDMRRQFVRLSMPSDAPWHEGYTENPLGVKPTGPIHGRRETMAFRTRS